MWSIALMLIQCWTYLLNEEGCLGMFLSKISRFKPIYLCVKDNSHRTRKFQICILQRTWVHATSAILWPSHYRVLKHIINSIWPSDAIWHHKIGSSLASVMACCLSGVNPLPEPMLTCHLLTLKNIAYPFGVTLRHTLPLLGPAMCMTLTDWKYIAHFGHYC